MGFFARPRLSNEQFVQHADDVLTLTGQTQIATATGLTLTDGSGNNIPVTASGASADFDVLTYCQGVISLKPSAASGGTNIYDCASPSTCTVGGLSACTTISGQSVNWILEKILVPTLSSSIVPESNSLSLLPSITCYEIGCSLSLSMVSTFDRGFVDPQYCGTCCYPVGLPTTHTFYPNWNPSVVVSCSDLTWSEPYVTTINPGTNPFCAEVTYLSGATPVYNSDGCVFAPAEPSGTTGYVTDSLCGIYPWYWGKVTCAGAAGFGRPTSACIKHEMTGNTCGGSNTGNKVVVTSTGTICTTFNTTENDYLWFATPCASTTKTCWYIDALNNSLIGGAVSPGGNLFPDPEAVTGVTSVGTGSWSNEEYKVYISNKQTCSTSLMQLRNS